MPFPHPEPAARSSDRVPTQADPAPPLDATSIPTGGGDALSATVLGDDPAHAPSQIPTGGGQALGNPTTHTGPRAAQ
jgi:hypothetical protein